MDIMVTTVAENAVPQGAMGLIGEHGQSFYIDAGEKKMLFDVGQGLALVNNAGRLGIDLRGVEAVMLSHGHNDHSGGLEALTGLNPRFTLVAHPAAFSEKFVKSDGIMRSRGIPVDAEFLRHQGVRLRLETGSVEIAPGAFTTGEIPMESGIETLEEGFFTKTAGEFQPDLLPDDQAFVLDAEPGLVVLLGCTHRGVINTLTHVRRLAGKDKIHAILGGLHLGKATDDKLDAVVRSLREFDIDRIGVGHCTGMRAVARLQDAFGGRVFLNGVGMRLEY